MKFRRARRQFLHLAAFVAALPAAPHVQGVVAPRNTPAETVDRLNKEISIGLADAKIKAQLAAMGASPFTGSPGEFGKFIVNEIEKWGKVIRAANIKVE